MNKKNIIIVGGGFGGIYTALHLVKIFNKEDVNITLINKSNFFLFTPLLHEVATGGLSPDSIIESVREVFRGTCVNIIEDTVIEISTQEKKVKTATTSFIYDYLVISTGAETNFFCTEGVKEHAFTLKNLSDAITLRNHILATCEKAVTTKNKDLLAVGIVGAGPTGVELAAELLEYMQHTICMYYRNSGFKKEDIKINLITTTPDIISQFPPDMREIAMNQLKKIGINILTNAIVTKVDQNMLIFKDGTSLKAHTLVWVAGVTPTLSEIKGIVVGQKGRMDIQKTLQVIENPEIFALGDAAGTGPMLAQVAVQQGKTVAENIYALVKGNNLIDFEFKQKGLLISIGQWFAIGNFFGLTFSGRIMWWIWRTAYLFNFLSWRKRFEIAGEWTTNLFYPRDITYLK